VRFERHLEHFAAGTPDHVWLAKVGEKKWALLTADKRIRYNILEKQALARYRVKEFVFASGNLSGTEMAAALETAMERIVRLTGRIDSPFVASITRKGEVHIRWQEE
jgi:PIN like domain